MKKRSSGKDSRKNQLSPSKCMRIRKYRSLCSTLSMPGANVDSFQAKRTWTLASADMSEIQCLRQYCSSQWRIPREREMNKKHEIIESSQCDPPTAPYEWRRDQWRHLVGERCFLVQAVDFLLWINCAEVRVKLKNKEAMRTVLNYILCDNNTKQLTEHGRVQNYWKIHNGVIQRESPVFLFTIVTRWCDQI